jgi:CRP/FNR family transcriptional regulator
VRSRPLRPHDFAVRLGQAAVLRGLGEATLLAIANRAELRTLKGGQVLWKQGQHAYELAFVWEGRLDIVRSLPGKVRYRVVGQNEVVGFSNAMGHAPCTVDVIAGEPTRVLLVPGDVLRSLVPKHPEIAFRALEHLGELVGRLSDEVELLHHGSLETRLLVRLRDLSAGRREIVITHEELASQVAARRESVTRTLKHMERRGVLRCRRGRIEIRDLDGGTV